MLRRIVIASLALATILVAVESAGAATATPVAWRLFRNRSYSQNYVAPSKSTTSSTNPATNGVTNQPANKSASTVPGATTAPRTATVPNSTTRRSASYPPHASFPSGPWINSPGWERSYPRGSVRDYGHLPFYMRADRRPLNLTP